MITLNTAVSQYKHLIITPMLESMGIMSPELASLVAGIGHQESAYDYIAQLNSGPALGYWQMEPFTHDDCWQNYLRYPTNSRKATALRAVCSPEGAVAKQMLYNSMYAAGMCAVKCIRVSKTIPSDAEGKAILWKTKYNTASGAGVVDAATIAVFRSAMAA